MKVGIFYNSISNPRKSPHKVALMDNFRQGVLANGDEVIDYQGSETANQPLDAGFVLGYTLADNLRKRIIDSLKAQGASPVFVDSNILHYARKEHEWHRYSLNSVYPNTGVYFFGELDKDKWQRYSDWHGVTLKPWRSGTNGQHILVLCQRPGGWNMLNVNQESWLINTIDKIKALDYKRPIVIRMHPGDGSKHEQISKLVRQYGNRISISNRENIASDLQNCWCTVGVNSTPNVVAAIEGVPPYLEDPTLSWAADVSFGNLNDIMSPPMLPREDWIHKIANIHWSNEEVRSGQLWSAIRRYIAAARR